MIRIELNDRELRASLRRLQQRVGDLGPFMREAGELLSQSTIDRFGRGVAPDGSRWAPNRPSTLARKRGSKPLIGETRELSRGIDYRAGREQVEVGSSRIYAATQQFGAKAGAFGRTRRGHKIPWGDIPARPFLGVSAADRSALLDALAEHLGPA
ncbi:Mu-like prophage protein gpG [Serpentinimonas raichei]|uniref:Mu-like prophage protein gpG n=1 Tax=Serpentinimonas raichei TaxID=1458425 RepID=A0A060NIB5_9BURK|nr:phage virion morphogenesis protein [Serpentinimonas raichei]BAO81042.1 Mu-like prophage protein gpG [Serpentinimonas raichei]